ncbi:hypothetical protein FOL47_005321 [Perkinsus chesapeaki]|uniref:non-specific serine/threonine protein kinase n=1 Tax=Perkinsus chesapeaki TaxID=330153 RepID=A0A7J6LZ11_PERCH|nr:hypothetical protein FOL47_005321 [Perkinsus chesapeaki]
MNRLVEAFSAAKNGVTDTKAKAKKSPARVYRFHTREVAEERPLSEGGFAYVSLMKDVHTGRSYAMKKMICTDRTRYQMALHECTILESLVGHPNIVNCYGHIIEQGEQPGSKDVCLLLDYCDGGHLLDLLDRYHGRVPTATIVKVMKDLMSAVNILHTQKPPIQHRDLKVENVLYNSASDLYTLCDFGSATTREYPDPSSLSKAQMATLEEDIQRYTTLMYRPPEMVDLYTGLPITTKSDIWMCGCILFTLICYRHPFQDQSVLAISNARYSIDPEAAERHPRPLSDLCRWMLSREPTTRPTAQQVLDVLENWNRVAIEGLTIPHANDDSVKGASAATACLAVPSQAELPSWQAFQPDSQPSSSPEQSGPAPTTGDWKSFTDPHPLRELSPPADFDANAPPLSSTAPAAVATSWGTAAAAFVSSPTVQPISTPPSGDSLPAWTAFGGSPSSAPPAAAPTVSLVNDTSQFTTGTDVWSNSPMKTANDSTTNQWNAFNCNSMQVNEGGREAQTESGQPAEVKTTTDLIRLIDGNGATSPVNTDNMVVQSPPG